MHVSQQAIAQSLAALKADGLVLYETIISSRDDWLIEAIESVAGESGDASLPSS